MIRRARETGDKKKQVERQTASGREEKRLLVEGRYGGQEETVKKMEGEVEVEEVKEYRKDGDKDKREGEYERGRRGDWRKVEEKGRTS